MLSKAKHLSAALRPFAPLRVTCFASSVNNSSTDSAWVNVQVKYCPNCRLDFPRDLERCPKCGGVLDDKTLRVPAEKA